MNPSSDGLCPSLAPLDLVSRIPTTNESPVMARLTGLYVGMDVAKGPKDWAYYITIGSAWSDF